MKIAALKYKTDDKMDIIIIVELVDFHGSIEWRIGDIKYKTSRQREYRFYSYSIRDTYDYRHTDHDHKYGYMYQKFVEFVGEDKLKEALLLAWESIKPVV